MHLKRLGFVTGGLALLLLSGCATMPPTAYVKEGVDYETWEADFEVCQDAGEKASKGAPTPYVPRDTTGTTAGVAGNAMVSGFAKGMAEAEARMNGYRACMDAHGYTSVVLTEADVTAIKSIRLAHERKRFYFDHFVSKGVNGLPIYDPNAPVK